MFGTFTLYGSETTQKMNRQFLAPLFSLFATAFLVTSAFGQEPAQSVPYLDPSLPVEKRVDDLISRMTLDEKASQLGHTAASIPRLRIPEYNWWNEGLHGVARAGVATVFPQAIGMAATFDEPLMHQVAGTISTEFRAKYYETLHPDGGADWYRGLTVWSPNINIFRDPRWGRGQETYGEDPFLTSRMGISFITGLQGNDPKYFKTIATSKHYAVHSGPESTRHTANIQPSLHDIEDTYLPAFRATITEAKAASVMCAYNALNGQPACANTFLLEDRLRKDWGFQGYVVSDCGAVSDVFRTHNYSPDAEHGVTAVFKAGMDLICGDYRNSMSTERTAIINAIRQGLLPESVVDTALRRLFAARFRLGMFDPPSSVPYSSITPAQNDTDEHQQLALRMGRESIVLLKNKNGVLPLKKSPASIAVIGPNADNLNALEGNYTGTPSKPVTILAGIRQRFPQATVTYVQGTGLVGPVSKSIPTSALCVDASCSEHGLKAEYFPNMKLESPSVMNRTDASVDFGWGDTGINAQLPNHYSVRWTGFLVPPESGEYLIGFTGQDGWRLWLDNNLVAEDWNIHHPATTLTKRIQLEKDHRYSVKIEYFQDMRSSEARFIWSLPDEEGRRAVDAAKSADLVVMVLGLSARVEGEEMKVAADGFAGGDRTSIDLPAPQEKLLERVFAVGRPTVLVLMNGSALGINWANANIPAILEAWYPGGSGGTAVAEAIAGDFSPAGRLPVTFYKSVDQLPPFEDYSMAKRTYRYFDGEPLYPFGFGLSYTSFAYGKPTVDTSQLASKDSVAISVEVKNTGAVAGDEVVQLYLTHPAAPGAPLRALKGFQRIHLAPGEKKIAKFELNERDLSIVDPSGKHRIVPGNVQAWLGGGQPIATATTPKPAGSSVEFVLSKEITLPN